LAFLTATELALKPGRWTEPSPWLAVRSPARRRRAALRRGCSPAPRIVAGNRYDVGATAGLPRMATAEMSAALDNPYAHDPCLRRLTVWTLPLQMLARFGPMAL